MTRTASSVGTSEASAQNHSPVDRQVGEAVAWRFWHDGGWNYSAIDPNYHLARSEITALIPASDLEQVTRERDEAVPGALPPGPSRSAS